MVELSFAQSDISTPSATLVELVTPDALSPADMGGADTRRLGVGMTGLVVEKSCNDSAVRIPSSLESKGVVIG